MTKWRGNPWAILVTLSLGFFMTLLDLTIVNIAIPNMISALDASLDEILWIVNAYVLVLAVLLITAGRLGDLRGQRTLFAVGVAVFTVASFACGVSPNATALIIFRAIQGLGAALLMPQTMSLIIATFPAERRGTALGVWGAVAGLATVAGPTLGGLLVTGLSWRWIFFVNIPVGIAVLVLTFLVIPDTRMQRQHRLDMPGVGLATAALFCVTFALIEGQRFSWGPGILALFAAAAVLFAAFLLQQRSRQDAEPLVPFVLFRDRNFAVINVIAALVSVGILGFYLPITIYLQSVLGFSALKAGLVLAPSSLIGMVLAPIAGRMSDRVGGKYILMAGLTAFGVGATLIAITAQVGTAWPALLPGTLVLGLGFGGIFAPMATETMRSVEPRMAGAASGVNNTIRQVGSVVGSAAVGAVLQARLATTLHQEALTRSAQLPDSARGQFLAGIAKTAKGGIDVGSTQKAAAPQGIPAQLAAQLDRIGTAVFEHGYVRAMHPTLVLPIVAMFAAAALCLLVTRHTQIVAVATTAGPAPELRSEGSPVESRQSVDGERLLLRKEHPMPTDAELVELEARRAELRERYLLPPAERDTPGRGIHHAALICSNVEQTIQFYQGLLGFPLVELVENRDYHGSSHFFFDLGNRTLLGFFDFPGLGLEPGIEAIGGVQHIAISVPRDRWEQLRDRLDAQGVKYAGPDLGIEESMYFKDPDGIQIELLSDPLMYFAGHQLDE